MAKSQKWLVVTDLDGSLLDDHYSWNEAEEAISRLAALEIPLILNSSKTLAEMKELASELGARTPIIAENGGILAIPSPTSDSGYSIEHLGLPRKEILDKAHAIRKREDFEFSGFADWDSEKVIECTGLSAESAKLSMQREATEPILWSDSSLRRETFEQELADLNIRILRGGRFLHLMGKVDKADGVNAVKDYFQHMSPLSDFKVVCLGDSENDLAMLNAADIAVVLPHPEGYRVEPDAPRVIYASHPSTQGWNQSILQILNDIS